MFLRLVHRLCHFMIYAFLFITRHLSFKLQRLNNTLTWSALMVLNLMQEEKILASRCVSGRLLGSKKLTHAAIIVNELHKEVDRPTTEQVGRVADLIMWLMLSLEGQNSQT